MPVTIEPLDSGELDLFVVLGMLKHIGFQGYGLGGDVYTNLKRSINAFKDMERRLAAHPHWAEMCPKLPWM